MPRSRNRVNADTKVMLKRTEARRALSEFLRSRRARLTPAEVGIAPGLRRLAPGLRREEVAQLAGIGVTWYTWLEQGREINVSDALLLRLANALRLDAFETAHLFALAQRKPTPVASPSRSTLDEVLDRVLAGIIWPAYVKNARWDVLAWNKAAAELFGDYASVPPQSRNVLWLVFTSPGYRAFMVDWERDAQDVLARFRVDFGRAAGDPAFDELVTRLSAISPEFRLWWSRQDVGDRGTNAKVFRHPAFGECAYDLLPLAIDGAPDLRMLIFHPHGPDVRLRLSALQTVESC